MTELETLDQQQALRDRRNYIILTITIFAGFLIFGFSENIKGPAIPRMQGDFFLTELQVGFLLASNSLGYLIACSFTAALARKTGLKISLILCLALMAVSGVLISLAGSYPVLLAAYFALNLGNGMLEISLGVMAAKIFTKNTGTMMNLSHFFYGLSSVFAPLLATGLMRARFGGQTLGWRGMYLVVLAFSLLPIVPALMGRLRRDGAQEHHVGVKAFLRNPRAWLTIVILSLAVTCEMGVGGWLVNYVEKAQGLGEQSAALVLMGFFGCFTLARLLFGPAIDKFGFVKSLLVLTAFGGCAIIAGVLAGRPGIALLIAAGFGIAPIYPTVMALIARQFSDNLDAAMTCTLTIMGGTVVVGNFMAGVVTDTARTVFTNAYGEAGLRMGYAAGYMFIGLCCLAAFGITVLLYRKLKKADSLL